MDAQIRCCLDAHPVTAEDQYGHDESGAEELFSLLLVFSSHAVSFLR
jgi:hypothetical protein